MDCTPRIALLAARIQELSTELNKNLDTLSKKLGVSVQTIETKPPEDILILEAAPYNIMDRQKDKENLKKELKIELKEILTTPIEYSFLHPDFSE